MFPRFLKYLIFFLSFFIILQFFTEQEPQTPGVVQDVELTLSKTDYSIGDIVQLTVKNNTENEINILQADCKKNPLQVYQYTNGLWEEKAIETEEENCLENRVISSNSETEISYGPWNYDLFGSTGKFKIEFPYIADGVEKNYFVEFEVSEPSFIVSLWNTLFYKPIYNSLIFLISVLPEYSNLGFAIILLTLVIKLILLGPNNRAIKAQQSMQKVQPELKKIQKKYAGDQQKIAEETMKIWKKHKVNPFGSCLPLFIQLPIMIALFYVVQEGLQTAENMHLLYGFVKDSIVGFDPYFLSVLDLTTNNYYVLPFVIGAMQYYQMSMITPKPSKDEPKKNLEEMDQAQLMQSTMKYVLPAMVALFTASLPAAVGLYWGTSTAFAIVQQKVLSKQK